MKFKKIAAAVLAAAVLAATPATGALFSPFSVTANAEETENEFVGRIEGDFEYDVTHLKWNDEGYCVALKPEERTVTITKYNGTDAEVEIPSTLGGMPVDSLGALVFANCTSVTNVIIPDSITSISTWLTFADCLSLKTITVSGGNANFSSSNGILFDKDKSELISYPAGKTETSYTVPNGVTSIGIRAFQNCKSLTSVTIPNSVTTIGAAPFIGCTSLKTITVGAGNANFTADNGVLFNKARTELVTYPAGKTETSYTIPDGVTTIGTGAFAVCKSLEDVEFPDSLTTLEGAFDGCSSLKSIAIPNGVTEIKMWSFSECTSLTNVTIPGSVATIDDCAFYNSTSLETVNYSGTKAEWEAIEINSYGNECLTNAEIICTDGIINERKPDTSDTSEPTSSETSEPTSSDTSEPTSSDTSEPTSSDTSDPTDPDPFVKENEVSTEIEAPTEAADIPESDRITSITINPAFNMKNKNDNDVELDLSKIKIKAEEIYDKEGLKRAEEALGETIKGNKHYNLLDLTLLYNGKDFSNGYEGLVKVIIPLPNGHRDKNFSCFRLTEVDGKMVKEVIPGEQTEDSYIIYLEHFSLYALVADANPDDVEKQPEESKAPEESAPVTPGDTDKNSGDNSGNNSGNDQANTGIALAIAPIALAASAVIVASKKKK